jgi:hypothetical protein
MFDVNIFMNTVLFLTTVVPTVFFITAYLYQIIKGIR